MAYWLTLIQRCFPVKAIFGLLILSSALAPAQPQVSERGRKLHQDALVFDAHIHMINRQFYSGGDIGDRLPDGQVDLPRLREGGVDALLFSLFVTEEYYPPRYETKQTLRLIDLALDAAPEECPHYRAGRDGFGDRANQQSRAGSRRFSTSKADSTWTAIWGFCGVSTGWG